GGMQGRDGWHPWGGASLFGGTQVENLEVMAAASYDYRDRSGLPLPTSSPSYANYAAYPALSSQNDIARPWSLYARLSYDAGRFGLLRLSGGLQNTDSKQEWVDNSIVPGANLALTHRTRVDQANRFARLEWSRHLGALELLTSVAYGWGGIGGSDLFDERDALLDRKRDLSYQSVTTVAEARYQPRRAFSLVGGLDYDAEFET